MPQTSGHRPEARNILVIKHGALGDIIQCDGALRDIRDNYPRARITVMTTPPYRALYERCPGVDATFIDPRAPRLRLDHTWKLRRRIHSLSPDLVIDLQNNQRTAFYRRYVFPDTNWSGAVPEGPENPVGLARFAALLKAAGLTTHHATRPDVSWLADDVSAILDRAGVKPGYIVLIPGSAARHPHKRWPHYAALAQMLAGEGYQTVTVPGPDELELCRSLPGIMLAGQSCLNLFELAGVLAQGRYVVGNDTGPSHIAAHIGAKGLALFGDHIPASHTGIERPDFRVLEARPLENLSPRTVLEEIRKDIL